MLFRSTSGTTSLLITCDPNNFVAPRTGTLRISTGNINRDIVVTQRTQTDWIEASDYGVILGTAVGDTGAFTITSSRRVNVRTTGNITISPTTGLSGTLFTVR